MKQKNVLLILTDDQRYNTIHALGNPEIKTPNLDFLAENGTAFTNAHIPCGTHGAVCMPSRAMLFTGRTLFSLEREGETIPPEHTMLGECLQGAGYEAMGCGKWHNGPPAFTRCFSAGENIFFGGMWDHWNVPTNRYDPTGAYDNVINFTANFFYENKTTRVHCDQFNPGVHSSELLTDTAIGLIADRREKEKPFFQYVAYLAPHDPRTMPEEFRAMYDPESLTLPANVKGQHDFPFGIEDIRDELLASYPRSEQELRRNLAEYYGMISHLDAEIGRLIAYLQQSGQFEDTLIVMAGDNGLAVGSHGLMGKQNHYDHSVRVPLLFCGAGIPKGLVVENFVYLLDIYPTLCELLGIQPPESVEGKSFAQMFLQPDYVTRESLYFVYNDLIRSVKDARYKLVEYRNFATKTQLFDLKHDPDELHNLADDPAQRETLKRMRTLLQTQKNAWERTGHRYTQAYWSAYER